METELLSPETEPSLEHLIVDSARYVHHTTADVPHSPHPASASIARRAWAGVIARKRRITLIAVAAAAVAVGSTGLSSAAAPIDMQIAAAALIAEKPESTIDVVSVPAAPTGMQDLAEITKGEWWEHQRAVEEAKRFRPLYVPFTHGVFTSGFGMRWGAMHGGVDIANGIGTPIVAVGDGVIIKSGDAGDGYGNSVKIRHTDGTITHYGHMSQTLVAVGQQVLAGDEIGLMGSTGDSTGPHCHFEVFIGGDSQANRIDPEPWLASRGIDVNAIAAD